MSDHKLFFISLIKRDSCRQENRMVFLILISFFYFLLFFHFFDQSSPNPGNLGNPGNQILAFVKIKHLIVFL